MFQHSDPLNPKKEAVSMSSNVNKYTLLNNKSTKKEIAEAFVEAGLIIKPYHGVKSDGSCTCNNPECKTIGKHPIFSGKGTCSLITFYERVRKVPELSVGLSTGYNPITEQKLVVLDIDNPEALSYVRNVIPSIDKTFAVKTKKGFHFYFLGSGKNFIKTLINWNGWKVDILAGKQGVITVGSVNKSIYQDLPMAELTEDEVKTLEKAKTQRVKVKGNMGLCPMDQSIHKQQIIDYSDLNNKFHAGVIERGSYHNSLFAVSSKELRRRANDFISGEYTQQDHVEFLLNKAAKYLADADMDKVAAIAVATCKNFDPEKISGTVDKVWNIVFKNNDEYTQSVIRNVLSSSYMIVDMNKKGEGKDNCEGTHISELMSHLNKHIIAAGITESVNITEKQFIIFLSSIYPELKKTKLDKIIDGKRVQKTVWNIAPTTTSISEPSSASTVRPNVKDEPVPASELESPVEAPMDVLVHGVKPHINFLEEKLLDLLNNFGHIESDPWIKPHDQEWAAEQKKKLGFTK